METTNIGQLTTYRIDSNAKNFIQIEKLEDLEKLQNITGNFMIIGGGSNLLMKESNYENKSFIQYRHQQDWEKIEEDDNYLYFKVYGGENLGQTVMKANKYSNQMSPLFGLPGTFSGAVIGNAGSYGKEIGEFIVSVELYDMKTHKIKSMNHDDIGFAYRHSILKNNSYLLISAIIKIPKEIDPTMMPYIEYAKKRNTHQPMGKSCGSWFKNYNLGEYKNVENIISNADIKSDNDKQIIKNIKQGMMKNIPAGWLIEQVGLKGYEKNGVTISDMHANFILNTGTTKGIHLFEMGELAKNKVYDKFDILLEEEVKIITD